MKKVRIIGVPEHFNLPWHMAIEESAFKERGIDLEWTDIPEGTGKMCQMLADEETDLAIILTEGIVKSITEGNTTKIVQQYISSPLLWGIHVAADSNYSKISDLKGTEAAISRFGSGSHLMAFVQAQNEGWDTNNLQFEVINNLDGAVNALTEKQADYFMWERFTTKPLVDNGTFRRIDDCPTPWPCFVIAATDKFITENGNLLQHIIEVINMYTSEFKSIPSIDNTLANTYEQKIEDIKEWLSITRWSQSELDEKTLNKIQETLLNLNLIKTKVSPEGILYKK
ncbi:ABC transporter substrate-binding protein [Cellulophaga baltica]|uniref:substrate-binding domain-containing protein n=1 Tax=Cellulophaga TaxID=104264 RepID=UPI001C074D8F|nr:MULTISPECIES: substrate-binding domain-containing protein [Cellulophaga]MBU2996367.1 ABC transporter substrate-binding protein [Cellulophaga baltica]MDO6767763.1 substrate-binding domain-containing protein [Cellulophaga sp. 1_MG-2023]